MDTDAADDSASTSTTVNRPPSGAITGPVTPSAPRAARLVIGDVRMRLPSGIVFVPLTCEFSPREVCIADLTVTFNTRRHKLEPIAVRGVNVGSGQTVDVYVAASRAQRRKMRRIGTIPVTVTATLAPEGDVTKAALLKGLRRP